MDQRDRRLTPRRTVLGLLGSGAALALAGCTGGDGGADDEPAGDGTTEPETTAPETAETDSVEAVDVPEAASCAVCEMDVAKFDDWNAQALHEDDTRAFFCSSGCAVTYHVAPATFAETDAAVAGLWVRDLETRNLIDGTDAHYALETKGDRLEDPMMVNPAPFAAREDAVAYVDAVDYLTSEDVVQLSAFDRALAGEYRGKFLE